MERVTESFLVPMQIAHTDLCVIASANRASVYVLCVRVQKHRLQNGEYRVCSKTQQNCGISQAAQNNRALCNVSSYGAKWKGDVRHVPIFRHLFYLSVLMRFDFIVRSVFECFCVRFSHLVEHAKCHGRNVFDVRIENNGVDNVVDLQFIQRPKTAKVSIGKLYDSRQCDSIENYVQIVSAWRRRARRRLRERERREEKRVGR